MSASADPGPRRSLRLAKSARRGPLLLTERRGGVLQVTLNRPAKLNALSRNLQDLLTGTLLEAARDRTLGCVILTGAGRGFCAGLDLSDVASSLAALGVAGALAEEFASSSRKPTAPRNLFGALEALPMPVIAAVNGPAYTGGLELALACDLIIAAPEARFGDTHAALGIMPAGGLSQRLSRVIGLPRAMAVSLAGQPLSGEDAFRAGLVSHLVPLPELLPLAWKLADAIAALDPAFAADLKRLIKGGAALPLADALALEQEAFRQWAQAAQLGPIQARTASVMTNTRASAASEGSDRTHGAAVHAAHPIPAASSLAPLGTGSLAPLGTGSLAPLGTCSPGPLPSASSGQASRRRGKTPERA